MTDAGGSSPFDIVIVGLGIVGVHQITREVEETIRRCRRTFVIDAGFGVVPYLKNICAEVTSLLPLYERGKERLPTYRRMAAEVVNAAIAGPPVCFATYGHPLVYCYPAILIQRAAELLSLRVEVFPGISSLDTLFVDLGFDAATDGLQMYETTDLLLRRRPIQNDVPCVLWQVEAIARLTYEPDRRSAGDFLPLQNYLLEFYPPEHSITFVLSKTFPLQESIVETYQLGTLATDLERGPQSGNLYIPPLRRREISDHKLLEKLTTRT
ncbi:MAG: SAM-dependent methyltransferase [Chthoniobacterales bacterium]